MVLGQCSIDYGSVGSWGFKQVPPSDRLKKPYCDPVVRWQGGHEVQVLKTYLDSWFFEHETRLARLLSRYDVLECHTSIMISGCSSRPNAHSLAGEFSENMPMSAWLAIN